MLRKRRYPEERGFWLAFRAKSDGAWTCVLMRPVPLVAADSANRRQRQGDPGAPS